MSSAWEVSSAWVLQAPTLVSSALAFHLASMVPAWQKLLQVLLVSLLTTSLPPDYMCVTLLCNLPSNLQASGQPIVV